MKRNLILSFILLLTTLSGYAQTGKLFEADKQLSSSFVNQVYLDRDGFIWVSTRNGLCRYDGYQFRIYKKDTYESMLSNYVNSIIQDSKGLFYIGMFGALQTFDGTLFHEVKVKLLDGHIVPCYVTCFAELPSGTVMVGTSGHGIVQMDSHTSAHQLGGGLAQVANVQRLMCDQKGRLWIVTEEEGLLVWANNHVLARYFQEAPLRQQILRVCEDKKGNIYVGTRKNGVFRLSGNTFVPIESTAGKEVSELYCSRDNKIMIGCDGQGTSILDPATGQLTNNPFFSRDVDLSLAKVTSITEDEGGNVWIGMLQKGIYTQPYTPSPFHYMGYKLGTSNVIGQSCVLSTLRDSKGRTWVGTDKDGIYIYDEATHSSRHITMVPSTILCMTEDKQGRVWVGCFNDGCGWVDPLTGLFHRQPLPQGDQVSVFGMVTDDDGHIWLGTMGMGLIKLNPTDGQMKNFVMKEKAQWDHSQNGLINNYISKISISPNKKRIYVSTTMGLACLDIASESWTKVLGTNNLLYGTPIRVANEYDGTLWIGTNTDFWRYDLKSKKMENLNTGLSKNGIASIEKDKTGKIWFSTDHGLCRLDPKSMQSDNYFVDDGLQSNEFSDGASTLFPDGRMLFGGVGGITWFDPSEISNKKWDAKVKITDFIINGKPVTPDSRSGFYQICDTTVIASNEFELGSHDNSFTISLSTLTYDSPEHITYLYSINGEPYVRLLPGQNDISFSHLSPGKYVFKVKAERNEISTPEHTFTVIVHAPWYRSTLAYLIYLLLIGAAIWKYLSYRRAREQEKLRLQEHIHAEEMGEAKLRFFMNISHEIRTPMTLIITPLLPLIKQEHDPQKKSVLETIRRNAERILNLINQMMDLRKIDKGMMQLHAQQTDMVKFVDDIHSLFELQTRAKRINLVYEHDTDKLPVWIDRQQFDKVLVNILSNAIKFTPADGEIKVRLTHDDQQAHIAISDNGEQIPADKLERIFERFYQTPSSVNDRNLGTGIGLDLTRSLVEMHHGTIKAHNLEQGCEFVVSIPLGNSHFKPEEISEGTETPDTEIITPEEVDSLMTPQETPLKTAQLTTIVIAEDDDEIRSFLEQELQQKYEVKSCSNGREALAMVLKIMPDLLLSDIMMPEMDGNALCSTIKSNPQTNDIPVVLLTAKTREEDKLEGLETGADAYIEKPFNMDILLRTVHNLIQSRQQLRMKYGRTDKLEEHVEDVSIKSPDEKLLERVMAVINKNISNSSLSVDSLADEVGISRVHLHRKMKELTGKTPHEIIRNIRLKQAANLLASGDMNITEVVYACGFGNAASFSTIFKRFYGMSPRDYMQEHQQRSDQES